MINKTEKYWIIVASKDHVRSGIKGGFAQACHGKANPLKRMHTGDYVIYYSSKLQFGKNDKCQQFTAIGKIMDNHVYQAELYNNFSPHRKDIKFYKAKDISILPLINDLEFIQNKQKWGYPFRWGIIQINEHDFKLISNSMLYEP